MVVTAVLIKYSSWNSEYFSFTLIKQVMDSTPLIIPIMKFMSKAKNLAGNVVTTYLIVYQNTFLMVHRLFLQLWLTLSLDHLFLSLTCFCDSVICTFDYTIFGSTLFYSWKLLLFGIILMNFHIKILQISSRVINCFTIIPLKFHKAQLVNYVFQYKC